MEHESIPKTLDPLAYHYSKKVPLTREEANIRSYFTRNEFGEYVILYKNFILLRRKRDNNSQFKNSNFDGRTEIFFTFHKKASIEKFKGTDFFLNFIGEIKAFFINDQQHPINYLNQKIYINTEALINNSTNKITILYSGRYTRSGTGLHYFVDPSDCKEYVYSHFEPFDCHRVFPCFDQPDMKAKMKLYVVAPSEWTVISNELECNTTRDLSVRNLSKNDFETKYELKFSDIETEFFFVENDIHAKDYLFHEFNLTEKISTYLFALCAGPYFKISCPLETQIPLNVYLRQSLKGKGLINEIFLVTLAGISFYSKYFGINFPFHKLDQIFLPEFNKYAMENVGLITYNEHFCFKDLPTKRQMTGFIITILHEVAHMWFGNLVTMQWWNDLWLNESFATFISHLCLFRAPELQQYSDLSWLIFNNSKSRAYRADQLNTTHPVIAEIRNSEIAETRFDEIVFQKGAAILKQIYYMLSDEKFSKGLRSYFAEFSWRNTTFIDFISKISNAEFNESFKVLYNSNQCLEEIFESHLKKTGLNEVELNMETEDDLITKFDINQFPCLNDLQHSNRQAHLIEILFLNNFTDIYSTDNSLFKYILIHPQQITSIDKFIGLKAPKAIILNYNDWAYFKWVIDKRSFNALKENISLIQDTLLKAQFYKSLFSMVRDNKVSAFEYIDLATNYLILEKSEANLPDLLMNIQIAIIHYIPLRFYQDQSAKVFAIILQMLKSQLIFYNSDAYIASKDLILTLLNKLIIFASTEAHYDLFVRWLEGEPKIDEVKIPIGIISQEHKFAMLKKIYESNLLPFEFKLKLLDREIANDFMSDRAVITKYHCYAARPEKAIKEEIWNKFVNLSKADSLVNMEAFMEGFAPITQSTLTQEYCKIRFFQVVNKIANENDFLYLKSFVRNLGPRFYPEEEVILKLKKLSEEIKENEILRKLLLELIDDLRRKKKAYDLCDEYLTGLNVSVFSKGEEVEKKHVMLTKKIADVTL